MWLLSCKRHGLLTQGPAPDPKCKLNISSFLTLPHLSDYLICTGNSMSIVLLLQMVGGWDRWGGGEGEGGCSSFFFFFTCALVLCSLVSSVPLF